MEKLKKQWEIFLKSPKQQIRVALIAIFLSMVILNLFTPLIADDYSYSLGMDGNKIETVKEVILYQINHYFTWGGRSVAHTIAQLFLLIPKAFFNISNAIVYTIFIYLMYSIVKNNKEDNITTLITLHLATWFFQPVFGQTCIWLIGSCNYLWTTTIILYFIKQYIKKYEKKDSKVHLILMFLLGLLAGWTNENTAVGTIIIVFLLLLVQKAKEKEKLKKWQISGFVGSIIGFLILILAPGNYVRTDQINTVTADNASFIVKIIRRFLDYTESIEIFILPLIIISVILISIQIYKKKDIKVEIPIFFTGAFFTIYSMVLSPQFPERSWFGVITFMLIAIAYLINKTIKINRFYRFVYYDILIIGLIVFCIQYVDSARSIRALQNTWNDRIEYIQKEKKKGNKELEVEVYWCSNSKCPSYGLADLFEEKDKWPNDHIAQYFELDSIAALPEKGED